MRQLARQSGPDLVGRPLGVRERIRQQLASSDLDFAHGGLPALWFTPSRPPPDQSPLSHCQHPIALSPSPADYRTGVAQRLRGGVVCLASTARRIGRLGLRAQGCPEHLLLPPHALGLRPLGGSPKSEVQSPKSGRRRQEPRFRIQNPKRSYSSLLTHHVSRFTLLPPFPLLLRPGPDEQADAGHLAVCPVAARLLATPTPAALLPSRFKVRGSRFRVRCSRTCSRPSFLDSLAAGPRETAILRAGLGGQRGHLSGAADGRRGLLAGTPPVAVADRQCSGRLCPLPLANPLARSARSALSVFPAPPGWGRRCCRLAAGRLVVLVCVARKAAAFSDCRLAMVFGHSGPHHWRDSGRLTINGRPLHVYPEYRSLPAYCVGFGCPVGPLAAQTLLAGGGGDTGARGVFGLHLGPTEVLAGQRKALSARHRRDCG